MIALATLALIVAPTLQDEIALEGRVLSPAGVPVAGAEVWLARTPDDHRDPAPLLARVASDADGRFAVSAPLWPFERVGSVTLAIFARDVAGSSGSSGALAAAAIPAPEVPVGRPIDLHLREPRTETVRIIGPDGEPVVGAAVRPLVFAGVGHQSATLPTELSRELGVDTDAEGRATITEWLPGEALQVTIEHPDFGSQTLWSQARGWAVAAPLALSPAGTHVVSLAAGGPDLALQLSMASYGDYENDVGSQSFEYGELRAGDEPLSFRTIGDGVNLRARADDPAALSLRQRFEQLEGGGLATRLEWGESLPVRGRVLDAETDQPVAGVRIRVHTGVTECWIETDEGGEYAFESSKPGLVHFGAVDPPPPYRQLERSPEHSNVRVEEGPAARTSEAASEATSAISELVLPDLRLARETSLVGRVVDTSGAAIGGAWVTAYVRIDMGNGAWTERTTHALADAEGRFSLRAGDGSHTVGLKAHYGGARSAGRIDVPIGHEGEVVLELSDLAAPRGRIVDSTGQPVAGARLEFWVESPPDVSGGERPVSIGGQAAVQADGQGRFDAPPALESERLYCAFIREPGCATVRTAWKTGAEWGSEELEITVQRLLVARGTLVDASGAPIAGATVSVHGGTSRAGSVTTGADGSFELRGIAPSDGFVFVDLGEGGFHGRRVDSDAPFTWAPGRSGEARLSVAPPAVPRGRELELAQGLLDARYASAREDADERALLGTLESLAWVDPSFVLAELEGGALDGWQAARVRGVVATALGSASPTEAVAVIETIEDHEAASRRLYDLFHALEDEELDRKLELAALGIARARSIGAPEHRLLQLGHWALALLDFGEHDAAHELFDEGRALAAEVPTSEWPGYARSVFAEDLAAVDLESALALVAEMAETENWPRHYGNMASKLAARSPADAEKVLRRVEGHHYWTRGRVAPGVCAKMAPVDLERARRIADDVENRSVCYAMIARAVALEEPELARELIAQAYLGLERRRGETMPSVYGQTAGKVAAALLPIAEEVDFERLEEYVWRTLSLRLPDNANPFMYTGHDGMRKVDACIAFYIARYDRELAWKLVQPALESARHSPGPPASNSFRGLGAALAVIDPERAAGLGAELPADVAGVIGAVLARDPAQRRSFVQQTYFGLWADPTGH